MKKVCKGVYLVAGDDISKDGDAMAYLVEMDAEKETADLR